MIRNNGYSVGIFVGVSGVTSRLGSVVISGSGVGSGIGDSVGAEAASTDPLAAPVPILLSVKTVPFRTGPCGSILGITTSVLEGSVLEPQAPGVLTVIPLSTPKQ